MTFARWLSLPLLLMGLVGSPGQAAELGPAARPAPPLVQGEVIVQFKAGASVLRRHALAAGAPAPDARSVLAQRAGTLGQRIGRALQAGVAVSDRGQVVRAEGVDAATLAALLAADADVEYAEPNRRRRAFTAPNDPLYPAATRPRGPDAGQWYLRAPTATELSSIDIEAAWTRGAGTGSASVVVAVLDTGVRPEHPELAGRLLPGYDFVSDTATANDGNGRDADPTDPGDWVTSAESAAAGGPFAGCGASSSQWHGTGTTALIGAATNNGAGMAGAAPGVRLLPVRVLGKCGGTDADIQAAMRWAAGLPVDGVPANPTPARVLNLSLGGDGACSSGYQAAVDAVRAAGTVVVAAAGNSNGLAVSAPANCAGVVSVLALRHIGTKVGFSDLGPEITLAAPGGNCVNVGPGDACLYPILTASNTGTQGPLASSYSDSFDFSVGTSYASPLVAGVAALMVSARPGLSPAEVSAALRASARAFPTSGADSGVPQCQAPGPTTQDQCYCTTAVCGAGMLDAGRALTAVSAPLAGFSVTPAAPTAGATVQLSSTSTVASGRTLSSYTWTLLSGGGAVTGFAGPTDTASTSLQPTAAGSVRVRLTVTDDTGASASVEQTITVAAPPPPPPSPPPPPAATGGGGGGAMSGAWLLLLALAAAGLRQRP